MLARILPDAHLFHSVNYRTIDEGKPVNPELDILCTTEKANYVVEIKGHELTNTDKVKINGFKVKFKESVGYGCHQACRAENHIKNEDGKFYFKGISVDVDKTLPVYKIVVTLQHFSSVIGHFKYLVNCGLMEKHYWNVWTVSLYDFMVVADCISDEEKLIEYLDVHNRINQDEIEYQDELDIFGNYLNGSIDAIIKEGIQMIVGGKNFFDSKYESLPLVR